jgi:hypothetical protein
MGGSCVAPSCNRRPKLTSIQPAILQETAVTAAEFDALWFSRPSHEGREAWELRLVAESPYALFETFAKDELEAAREEGRKEMENRMRERATNNSLC